MAAFDEPSLRNEEADWKRAQLCLFDIRAVLAEACRVLKPDGWLGLASLADGPGATLRLVDSVVRMASYIAMARSAGVQWADWANIAGREAPLPSGEFGNLFPFMQATDAMHHFILNDILFLSANFSRHIE